MILGLLGITYIKSPAGFAARPLGTERTKGERRKHEVQGCYLSPIATIRNSLEQMLAQKAVRRKPAGDNHRRNMGP